MKIIVRTERIMGSTGSLTAALKMVSGDAVKHKSAIESKNNVKKEMQLISL